MPCTIFFFFLFHLRRVTNKVSEHHRDMANSKFEYVKTFERETHLLPECSILIRVDGRGFHKFSDFYEFEKPNDVRALNLMNKAAHCVMQELSDVFLAYGDSDEYSFLLRRNCQLFERREAKLITTFASSFTAYYITFWSTFFPETPLNPTRLPTFDARAVTYPHNGNVRDYFAWRQVDCHINNLYNTTFWGLIQCCNLTPQESENKLIGTLAKDKHEILFKDCQINYNNEPEMFKKGTVLVREVMASLPTQKEELTNSQTKKLYKNLKKAEVKELFVDIIKDEFWLKRPWLLS